MISRWVMVVSESVFLHSPDEACPGDLPQDMPRQPETSVSLCHLMLKHHRLLHSTGPLDSGRIVPRVTMVEGNFIHLT